MPDRIVAVPILQRVALEDVAGNVLRNIPLPLGAAGLGEGHVGVSQVTSVAAIFWPKH